MPTQMTCSELAEHLRAIGADEDLVLFDARPTFAHYRGHIRSAVSVCLRPSQASADLEELEASDNLDDAAKLALRKVPLAQVAVVYDSGGGDGSGGGGGGGGPAATLAALLEASVPAGQPEVAILDGGFRAFTKGTHRSLVVTPPPSAGHASASGPGTLDLTPKGWQSASPACVVLSRGPPMVHCHTLCTFPSVHC